MLVLRHQPDHDSAERITEKNRNKYFKPQPFTRLACCDLKLSRSFLNIGIAHVKKKLHYSDYLMGMLREKQSLEKFLEEFLHNSLEQSPEESLEKRFKKFSEESQQDFLDGSQKNEI